MQVTADAEVGQGSQSRGLDSFTTLPCPDLDPGCDRKS